MKKTIKLLLSLAFILNVSIFSCNHIHTDECNYDETTQSGCTHTHDENCYLDPNIILDPEDGHG